ncbi:MAG: hypothetical protein ABEJ35_04230 [Halobacteriaceae archaeon]
MTEGPDEFDTRYPLRTGGTVGLAEDALFVETESEGIRIDLDDVAKVTHRDMDWFVALLAVVVVGFGLFMTRESILGGVAFVGIGLWSGYRAYTTRQEVKIRVRGRTKPVTIYPTDAEGFYQELGVELETGGEGDQSPNN